MGIAIVAVSSKNSEMPDTNTEQLNNVAPDYRGRQAQKKIARGAEALRARRKRVFKKVGYWTAGLAVVVGGGWLLVSAAGPKGPDYSESIPVLGRNHIADGTRASYNSTPPTSGPHYASPAPARFYDEELPDEQLVHNLEHGHIWISYKPDLPLEVVKVLKDFAGGNIVVTPRSQNDTDVALTGWGRLDKFNIEANGLDKQRVEDFISRYKNRGPENVGTQGHF